MPNEIPLNVLVPQEIMNQVGTLSDYDLEQAYQQLFNAQGKSSGQQTRLQALQNELSRRKIQTQQQQQQQANQQIMQALTGAGGIGDGGDMPAPQFDIGAITSQEQQSLTDQQKQLQQAFTQQLGLGSQAIRDQFNPIRSRQIAERAALGPGVLESPASLPSIYNIDVQQGRALSDLISRLGISQAEQQVGLDTESARRLQQARQFGADLGLGVRGQNLTARGQNIGRQETLANLLQGQYQFGAQQGLREREFGEQQREYDIEQQRQDEAQAFARQLGLAQAEAGKSSGLSDAMGILGGIGSLAGGIGGLMGGYGALRGASGALAGAGQIAGGATQLGSQFSGFGGPYDELSLTGYRNPKLRMNPQSYQDNLSPYSLREQTAFNPYTLNRKPYSYPYSRGRQLGYQTGGDYAYSTD